MSEFKNVPLTNEQIKKIHENESFIVSGGGGFPLPQSLRDVSLNIDMVGAYSGRKIQPHYNQKEKNVVKLGFTNLKVVSATIGGKPLTDTQKAELTKFIERQNAKSQNLGYSVLVNLNQLVTSCILNAPYRLNSSCLVNDDGKVQPFAVYDGEAKAETAEQLLPAIAGMEDEEEEF